MTVRMLLLPLALATLAVACGDKDPVDTGTAPGLDTDTDDSAEECSGEAPVITGVSCENSGIQPHYETSEDTVTMTILADTEDADGDLSYYTFELFYDDEVDGAVDTSSSNFSPSQGTVDADECDAGLVTVGTVLYLPGGDPDFDTHYEWAVVVSDAASMASDPYIFDCWTPTSDGEDGGQGSEDSGG